MKTWDELSMAEKSEMIGVAVRNGITDLATIRQKYNEFAEGGSISNDEYLATMEKVADENYKKWGFNNPDVALMHALNDNTYDYRGYYSKYPQSRANADTHWPDEFKTVYHPTFSNESIYSGKKSQYNPYGLPGGFWIGDDFIPMAWQLNEHQYGEGGGIHIKPSHRGRLTELKKRTGKTEEELYRTGSPATRKMITFARNARKWKHDLGGPLVEEAAHYYDGESEKSQQMNDEFPFGDQWLQEVTVYPGKEEARRLNNWLINRGYLPAFMPDTKNENAIEFHKPFTRANGSLEIVSPEFDLITVGDILKPVIKRTGAKLLTKIKGPSTPKFNYGVESSLSSISEISNKDALQASIEGKQHLQRLINSAGYKQRLKNAFIENNLPVNQADMEVLEMNTNVNDANLVTVPNLWDEDGKVIYGLYDKKTGNLLVSRDRKSIYDVRNTAQHEYVHAAETDNILEMLGKKWDKIKPKKKAYTSNKGVVDIKQKNYLSGAAEKRARSMAVWSDMDALGFKKIDKYLDYLKKIGLKNDQWESLVDIYGPNNAKRMVETVFGISPFILMNSNQDEKENSTLAR